MTSLRVNPVGYGNQNLILEKLHDEAIQIHSVPARYIPRTLIAEDLVLGEDRLSEFKEAYPIDIYIENADGFTGQGSFASKFGLQIDSGGVFVISKRGWAAAVARFGETILPNRPGEGDLIYLPMNKGLFEINYVDHQAPFYQLGQYYSYKCNVELFRYSSEKIDTGVDCVDDFNTLNTQDVAVRPNPDTTKRVADNTKFKNRASTLVLDKNNPFGDI
jgi:hypothetical protein